MEQHTEHIDDLVEGYALGALDPREQVHVSQHLATCPACRQHVVAAEDAAHMLAFVAAPAVPPLRCKRQVMDRIEREQFLATPTRSTRARLPLTGWATLAALALFVMTGAWSMRLQQQLSQVSTSLATSQAEMAQMRTQVAQIATFDQALIDGAVRRDLLGQGSTPQAKGLVSMTPGQNKATILIDGLPPLPAGQEYKVWVAREDKQEPLAAFPAAAEPTRLEIVPSEPMDRYKWIMVTVEPAQSTQQPSNQQVLYGDL